MVSSSVELGKFLVSFRQKISGNCEERGSFVAESLVSGLLEVHAVGELPDGLAEDELGATVVMLP